MYLSADLIIGNLLPQGDSFCRLYTFFVHWLLNALVITLVFCFMRHRWPLQLLTDHLPPLFLFLFQDLKHLLLANWLILVQTDFCFKSLPRVRIQGRMGLLIYFLTLYEKQAIREMMLFIFFSTGFSLKSIVLLALLCFSCWGAISTLKNIQFLWMRSASV